MTKGKRAFEQHLGLASSRSQANIRTDDESLRKTNTAQVSAKPNLLATLIIISATLVKGRAAKGFSVEASAAADRDSVE